MNIACVTWGYDEHQGIPRCVFELTARLAREHEVHVYTAHAASPAQPGVQLHVLPVRLRRPYLADWDFFFRAGGALRRARHDLVHAHFPVAVPADVYTCHGLARMALRRWRGFPPDARREFTLRRTAPWYLQIPLYSYTARRAGRIAAVSRATQREVAEEGGRPLREIDVIPNAVDLERFRPCRDPGAREKQRSELGLLAGQFALLWVGAELSRKGMRQALETLAQLPENVVLLALSGDRPSRHPSFAALAAELERAGRLRVLDPDPAIERCYAAVDALLFPSLYESFGLVVLEAMATGLPVVTARTVGFAEDAIQDGENGFLVDRPWDVAAMAQRVAQLARTPELCARMGSAARRTAQRYSWDAYARATEQLYAQRLVERSRCAGVRSA